MEATCETCRFWKVTRDDPERGSCRRMPPERRGEIADALDSVINGYDIPSGSSLHDILHVGVVHAKGFISCADWGAWPETDETDWCGEHQPRDTETDNG